MQTLSFRTTVDIDLSLAQRLKEFSAKHGLTRKKIIVNALKSYMTKEASEKDADKLWKELRILAKKGIKRIDLVEELRKDRNR